MHRRDVMHLWNCRSISCKDTFMTNNRFGFIRPACPKCGKRTDVRYEYPVDVVITRVPIIQKRGKSTSTG